MAFCLFGLVRILNHLPGTRSFSICWPFVTWQKDTKTRRGILLCVIGASALPRCLVLCGSVWQQVSALDTCFTLRLSTVQWIFYFIHCLGSDIHSCTSLLTSKWTSVFACVTQKHSTLPRPRVQVSCSYSECTSKLFHAALGARPCWYGKVWEVAGRVVFTIFPRKYSNLCPETKASYML